MILLTSSHLRVVECRALRSMVPTGCDQAREGGGSMGVTQFGVASDNNSSSAIRNLMFKLASGPSKRGKGH